MPDTTGLCDFSRFWDGGAYGRSATHVLSSTQTIVIDAGLGIPPTPTPTNTPTPTPTPTPTSTPTPTATPTQPQSPLPTPTQPQSPLPTPRAITLPNGVSETAVYVIQDSDYETVLSASVREALWSRGEPVPDTVPAEELPSTALHHSKSGLLSLAPSPVSQSVSATVVQNANEPEERQPPLARLVQIL